MATRTDITIAGSAAANQPARLVLTSATNWAWPDDLGRDCQNCYFEHNGVRIKHWFEDSRRARASVWLNSPNAIAAGDTLTLVSGVSRPRRKPRPKDVGLLAGWNASDFRQLQNRRPYRTFLATAQYEGVTATYQHNTSFYRNPLTGEVVLFWEFGADANELEGLKYIARSRSTDNGNTFSAGQIDLYETGTPPTNITGEDHQIPGPAWTRADGKTVKLFAAHHNTNFEGALIYTAVSTGDALDGDNDWAAPAEITGSTNYIVGSDPIVMSNGNWAFGAQRSTGGSRFYYSADEGATWGFAVIGAGGIGLANEVAVWEVPGDKGHCYALGRAAAAGVTGKHLISESLDYGRTWTPWAESEHNSTQSKPQVLVHSSGLVLLCINDWAAPANKGAGVRRNLSILISEAGGRPGTWDRRLVIQDRGTDTYAYPTMVEVDGGDVLVAYSVSKANLEIMRITAGEIAYSDQQVSYRYQGGLTLASGGHRVALQQAAVALNYRALQYEFEYPLAICLHVGFQPSYDDAVNFLGVQRRVDENAWFQLMRVHGQLRARYREGTEGSGYGIVEATMGSAAEFTIDVTFPEQTKVGVSLNGTALEFPTATTPIELATPYNHNQDIVATQGPQSIYLGPSLSAASDTTALAKWQQFFSAAVCHDPAFLTGAL